MSIAREMDAPLIALALVHAKLAHRPGNEDLCTQIVAAQQHLEELRLAVQALEELATSPPRPGGAQVITLHDRRPRLVRDADGAA
jgi:hypothetical protein